MVLDEYCNQLNSRSIAGMSGQKLSYFENVEAMAPVKTSHPNNEHQGIGQIEMFSYFSLCHILKAESFEL